MKKIREIINERKFKYICFFWNIISVQFVIGSNLQTKGYSINSVSEFLISLLKVLLYSVIFIILHYCILEVFNRCKKDTELENRNITTKKYSGIIYFLIIVICWIPALLAFYPIILNYDGVYQIQECLTGNTSTRHPILHTLLLATFYKFGMEHMNSSDTGMFLFSIFQMTIMAGIFSYSVKFVEEKTNRKWLRNICILFYAIFPINQLFPIMTTKDVLFAGFTLLFIINLYKIYEGKYNKINYIYMIITSALMTLFRNNAIYALIVSIPFIVLILIKDKNKLKKMTIWIICILITYDIVYNSLIYITNSYIDTNQEKLSIFSQGTANICKEKENELTKTEKAEISYFFQDYKTLGETYKTNISDNTKKLIVSDNFENNKTEFFKLMTKLGKKYPRLFIESFLNTTRGYWYILDQSYNQIGHKEKPNSMGYLELPFNEIQVEEYKVNGYSVLPEVKEFYKSMFCQNNYTKIPVLYIIFQPATYFYIVLAYLLYSIYKRDKINLIIGVYLFLYFITCFLGPVAIIRYIYAVIVCIPVIGSITINEILKE